MIVISCSGDNKTEAEKSLIGEWSVDQIYSAYGQRVDLGTIIEFDTTEIATEGSYVFREDGTASFYYSRLDTLYSASDLNWNLSVGSVNCGFTMCDVYMINMDGRDYEAEFGDQTNDAHIDATDMRLIFESLDGPFIQVIYFLSKG